MPDGAPVTREIGEAATWRRSLDFYRRLLVTDYQFGSGNIHHLFCKRCGVKTFGRGHLDALGGEFHAVNVSCLDGLTPEQLANIPVKFEDGRSGHYDVVPPYTNYL